MKRIKHVIAISAVALLVVGCVNPVKKQHDDIVGQWRITNIAGTSINNSKALLIFSEDGKASGNSGCNNINSSYKPVHDHLNLQPFSSTRKLCPGQAGSDEKLFNNAVLQLEHFLVQGNTLLLTDEQDETVITLIRF
jgi:heat shock protein HslJ